MDAVTSVSGKLFEDGWSRVRGSRQGLGAKKASYGILRVAKVKSMGNMAASLQHTFRERETPNADERLRGENTILMGAPTSAEVLDAWKARAPERIRSNAVHGIEYFVGGSPERMNTMSMDEQDRYFADALDWIVRERGAQNVLSAVVHRDEFTPHMTVMTIPLDDAGKLNARSIVGNRGKLSQMQTDFADQVSEKYGLKRGVKGSLARHERVKRAYGTVMGEKEEIALPERVRGSLLRGRGESEAQWRERAEEAMRGALSAQERAGLPPISTGQFGVIMEGPNLCLGTCLCPTKPITASRSSPALPDAVIGRRTRSCASSRRAWCRGSPSPP